MYISPLYNTLNCFHRSSLILDTLYVTSCLHAWHELIDNCENIGCQQFDTKMEGIILRFAVLELLIQNDKRCLNALQKCIYFLVLLDLKQNFIINIRSQCITKLKEKPFVDYITL